MIASSPGPLAPSAANPEFRLIDIGANLTHESFHEDLDAVLQRAENAGVERIVVTGSGLECSRQALALAQAYPARLACTAGVHPHHAASHGAAEFVHIADLAAVAEVRAVGETGLDFYRDFSPRVDQERAFEVQLEIAADTGLPVFLHERDAHTRFIAILARYRDRISAAVVHCFTGDRESLAAYLDMDLYVGLTGWICDERRGAHLWDLAGLIPDDRLMIETDAPYLLPRDLRPRPKSRRNEPMYLPRVLAAVAKARQQPMDHLAVVTRANAERFFNWPGDDACAA